ncbi:MAG: hypothetical protein ABEJ57_03280 [Halobacteriaceae archaeon]
MRRRTAILLVVALLVWAGGATAILESFGPGPRPGPVADTTPTDAVVAALATDRSPLPARFSWLFAPGRSVLATVAVLATTTITLLVLSATRSLFTTPLALLTYTLAVPVFDGIVVLEAIDRGPFTLPITVIGGLLLIAAQVLWGYGLAYALTRVGTWSRARLD